MKSRMLAAKFGLMALALICQVLSPGVVQAQPEGTLCVPEAWGVPGKGGPPQWLTGTNVDPKLDDPRWVGSTSQLYPISGSSTQAEFRALVKSNVLYVSFHTLVDPAGTGAAQEDWVYLALAQNDASVAKIVGVKVNTTTDSDDVQSGGGVTSAHYFTAPSPTGAWVPDSVSDPKWAQDVGVWRKSSTEWAINFKVELGPLGIAASPMRMWGGIVVQATTGIPQYVTYSWPVGTTGAISASGGTPPPGLAGTPDTITDIDEWGEVNLGSGVACTDGVSLAWNQIGVVNGANLGHEIHTISNNTFAARPSYNGTATPAQNKIAARFRIANWGSTSGDNWTDLEGLTAVQSNPAGNMEKSCQQGAASGSDPPPCPELEVGQQKHQCMLVTLGPGTTPGASGVTFLNDSVYRNMEFVNSSYFERDAKINIKGLKPLATSKGLRDVYLYVRTKNMPAKTEQRLDPKVLAEAVRQAEIANLPPPLPNVEGVKGHVNVDRPAVTTGASQQRKITTSKRPAEILSDAWPTYEVHVYYDTGKKRAFGKDKVLGLLQPGLPFGYYVNHAGGLEGWLHQLAGVGATLEQIEPNFYKVKVPDDGEVTVVTRIEAVEPGRPPTLPQIGQGKTCEDCPATPGPTVPPVERCRCACRIIGEQAPTPWSWLGAGSLGLIVLGARRRSRRKSNRSRPH